MEDLKRRSTDSIGERVVTLETDFGYVTKSLEAISNRLEQHIINNTRGFDELRVNINKLATSNEIQTLTSKMTAETMDKISDSIASLVKSELQIHQLQEFNVTSRNHMLECSADRDSLHKLVEEVKEKIDRLYWVGPILVLIMSAGWVVLTHFKII